jgi:hypothetical protein
VKIGVEIDAQGAKAALGSLQRQVPFATALALTRTAEAAKVAVQQEMASVFDRPTPFTFKAMRVIPARPAQLEAAVVFKDLGGKGLADAKTRYGHQVFGGARATKRMETLLRRSGLLLMSEDAVPGEGAQLDAYGNMSRGQIVQILSWFQTFGEEGFTANSTKATRDRRAKGTRARRGQRFFFRRDRPGRGIYLATAITVPSARRGASSQNWAIKPVLMFVRRSMYKPRLDVEGVVQRTAQSQFRAWFDDALREAVRTAR